MGRVEPGSMGAALAAAELDRDLTEVRAALLLLLRPRATAPGAPVATPFRRRDDSIWWR